MLVFIMRLVSLCSIFKDKTIKLWKITERDKRPEGYNLKDEEGKLKDLSTVTSLQVRCGTWTVPASEEQLCFVYYTARISGLEGPWRSEPQSGSDPELKKPGCLLAGWPPSFSCAVPQFPPQQSREDHLSSGSLLRMRRGDACP